MSIAIPNPILLHHHLPHVPKCLHIHQFSRDHPESHFTMFSIVYLPNLYNTQATRPVKYLYGAGVLLYILFIFLLYMLFGLKFICLFAALLYLYKLQHSLTPGMPGSGQGMPGSSPGSRRTNQEGDSPN